MAIDWNVNLLRLSVFSTDNTTASDATWKVLTGQDEAETRNTVPGGRSFGGAAAGGFLSLTHSGSRLDLLLQPRVSGTPEPEMIPVIGPWADVRATFDKMSVSLLNSSKSPIVRLAVGSVLLAKSDSLENSYGLLKDLLKSVQIDPKKTRDLHYRVNWPVDSDIAGLKVNRLTTWAAMRFSTNLMQITGDKVNVSAAGSTDVYAVRMECDHNTDATNQKAFAQDKIVPIYYELMDLVQENAEKGEVLS